jgi:hypothetical protein
MSRLLTSLVLVLSLAASAFSQAQIAADSGARSR